MLRILEIGFTLIWRRRTIDITIVEVYSGASFFIADLVSLLGKCLGLRTIGVLHGGSLPEFAAKYPNWSARVFRRFTVLVAPSSFLKHVVNKLGFNVRIIPNVINLKAYPFKLRRDIAPKLIWMRAFHNIYNPELAIKAFALVREKHSNATLVMAGVDKGMESSIKQLVRNLGLQKEVRFPGFLDSKAKVLEFSQADIFLNTNDIDNMPVAVVESCAFGLPVIATDVGGISSLLKNGTEGILVPRDNAQVIAEAVDRLLDDTDLTEHISQNGRSLAERSSWESVRPSWVKLFGELGFPRSARVSSAVAGRTSA
ncbi:MAG: glycosyltransferase family 4 protein [Acidobacteria bacterium]|nr:glycosyltransferase family 4 protein [Acidobacteriota bacterium]